MKVSKPLAAVYALAVVLLALPGAWLLFAPQSFVMLAHGGDEVLLISPLFTQQTGLGLLLAAAVNLVCLVGGPTRVPLHVAVLFYLAGLVASPMNLLVLDEPSNHLDIPSAERLERALVNYGDAKEGRGGALVLISHDRALVEATCTTLIVFDGEGDVQRRGHERPVPSRAARQPSPPRSPRRYASHSTGSSSRPLY